MPQEQNNIDSFATYFLYDLYCFIGNTRQGPRNDRPSALEVYTSSLSRDVTSTTSPCQCGSAWAYYLHSSTLCSASASLSGCRSAYYFQAAGRSRCVFIDPVGVVTSIHGGCYTGNAQIKLSQIVPTIFPTD